MLNIHTKMVLNPLTYPKECVILSEDKLVFVGLY